MKSINDNALITKQYVDELIEDERDTTFIIGEPRMTLSSTLPSNCIWLQGQTVSRTTYADLFSVYGTTYGSGDGSTTFGLPNFTGRVPWGYTSFGYISAGLPNIYGKFSGHNVTPSGAFAATGSTAWHGNRNNNSDKRTIVFDASTYNSIYGSSSTVQPPAIKVRFYTRYQ